MKYFIDTEFIEGPQRKRFLGIPTLGLKWDEDNQLAIYRPYTPPTIDLISIGIVAEDGREYYAISKDFNLKEAWNRYDLKWGERIVNGMTKERYQYKNYWIRENVLKPIFIEEWMNLFPEWKEGNKSLAEECISNEIFTYSMMKRIIDEVGKSNEQIAREIRDFIGESEIHKKVYGRYEPQFYGYYADYDWVVFCWLFGRMIDLPKGFPKYCRDLKQMYDEAEKWLINHKRCGVYRDKQGNITRRIEAHTIEPLKRLKDHPDYPKQTNEHNALADAKWNKQLYYFIEKHHTNQL